jgi:ankyrin repeat protein
LHLALDHGHFETVKLLLERGANVHVHNDVGWTPFQMASTRGQRKIAELLSEYGAH